MSDSPERMQARPAVGGDEGRFQTLLRSANDVVVCVDKHGRVTEVNDRIEAMFGRKREEVIGKNFASLGMLGPGELPGLVRAFAHSVRRGRMADGDDPNRSIVELRIRRDTGEMAYIEANSAIIRRNGRLAGFLSILRDITERKRAAEAVREARDQLERRVAERTAELTRANRKLQREASERNRAEQALRASEAMFRNLLENVSGVSIVGYETDGTIRYWNRAGEQMYGYTTRQAVGKDLGELIIPPEARAAYAKALSLGAAAGASGEFFPPGERDLLRKDGTRVPVYSKHTVLCLDGQAPLLFSIDLDLSERKRSEEARRNLEEKFRLVQRMESISRLAAGVAHDFNNQLTVIRGYCDVLLRGTNTPDVAEALDKIRQASGRAEQVTSQLLTFARKQVLRPEVLDLGQVVRRMEAPLARLIGEDVRLSVAADEQVGNVKLDRAQLERAIVNLVVNALDAMPQGGQLTIRTTGVQLDAAASQGDSLLRPDRYVMLAVSDTGEGMDPKTRKRIFEPFFTTKEFGKGTGLGLAMVYGFVRQSGGQIEVESEPGRGTTLKLYLPQVGAAADSARPQAVEPQPGGTETILVVEDEQAVHEMLTRLLRQCGYTVLAASNGREALPLGEHYDGPIDLLITDVVMPGINGPELARRVRSVRPGLQVLFVSEYAADALSAIDMQDTDAELLAKPFSPAELATTVRRILRAARPTEAEA